MNANVPQTDTDAERISVDFVLLPRESGDEVRYEATCTDIETGAVIGCRVLPRIADVRDIVEMMGGAYRRATIDVDVQTEQLAQRSRREPFGGPGGDPAAGARPARNPGSISPTPISDQ